MTKAKCECGCGLVADSIGAFDTSGPSIESTVHYNEGCWVNGSLTFEQYGDKIRSRRAQPKAELGARPFLVGDRVRVLGPYLPNGYGEFGVVIAITGKEAVEIRYDDSTETDIRGTEALALRDGHTNATPPAPSAAEPKPNPLRGDAAPGTCRSCSAFAAVRISANCTYCASRLHGTVRHYEDGDGIVAAVQPAAVEEVRQPWDWDPTDVGYLP